MILLVDNYDSFTYNLYQLLAPLYDDIKVVRNDKIDVDEVKQLNPKAIVLSPGPGRPENAGVCLDLIRELHQTTPILGICLGHQAIAQAFGGNIIHAKQVVHGKDDHMFHNGVHLFKGMPLPFAATRYHSLCVERESLPAELMVTSENADGTVMAIKHQQYPVYGVQFHPESIISEDGTTLLKNFIEVI